MGTVSEVRENGIHYRPAGTDRAEGAARSSEGAGVLGAFAALEAVAHGPVVDGLRARHAPLARLLELPRDSRTWDAYCALVSERV